MNRNQTETKSFHLSITMVTMNRPFSFSMEVQKSRSSFANFLIWLKHLNDIIKQRFPFVGSLNESRENLIRLEFPLPFHLSLLCPSNGYWLQSNFIFIDPLFVYFPFKSDVMCVRDAMKKFIAEGLTTRSNKHDKNRQIFCFHPNRHLIDSLTFDSLFK